MKKLSIGKTVSDTFGFPLGDGMQLWRSCWSLFLLLAGVQVLAVVEVFELMAPFFSGDTSNSDLERKMADLEKFNIFAWVLEIITYVICIPIFALAVRIAVGHLTDLDHPYERMTFGRRELLCAAGAILFFVIGYALGSAVVLAVAIIGGGNVNTGFDVAFANVPAFLLFVVAMAAVVIVMLRLAILPAIGAVGQMPNPLSAWKYTSGNNLKFLGLAVALFIVSLILNLVIGLMLLPFVLPLMSSLGSANVWLYAVIGGGVLGPIGNYLYVTLAAGFCGSLSSQFVTLEPAEAAEHGEQSDNTAT